MSITGVCPPRPALLTRTSSRPIRAVVDVDQRVDLAGGRHVADHALHPAEAQRGQRIPGLAEPSLVVIGDHRRRHPPAARDVRWPSRSRCPPPRSRRRPCRSAGRGRRRRPAVSDSDCHQAPRLPRQAEHPLGDDVALDLVGAAVDGVGAGEQEQPLPLVEFAADQQPSRLCPRYRMASSPRSRCQLAHNSFDTLSCPPIRPGGLCSRRPWWPARTTASPAGRPRPG